MSEQIKCIDGQYRTRTEYNIWLANLRSLYEIEPNDLTDIEKEALRQDALDF